LCIAGNIENSKPAVESPAALNVQTAAEKVRYRNTAKSSCSVSIPLPQDLKKRLDQYLDVELKAPIIPISDISPSKHSRSGAARRYLPIAATVQWV
jgi:hypothetical protein